MVVVVCCLFVFTHIFVVLAGFTSTVFRWHNLLKVPLNIVKRSGKI